MATNNQETEVIKDEYHCKDCMWKEKYPTHCDRCMVAAILNYLNGLEDEESE